MGFYLLIHRGMYVCEWVLMEWRIVTVVLHHHPFSAFHKGMTSFLWDQLKLQQAPEVPTNSATMRATHKSVKRIVCRLTAGALIMRMTTGKGQGSEEQNIDCMGLVNQLKNKLYPLSTWSKCSTQNVPDLNGLQMDAPLENHSKLDQMVMVSVDSNR